MQLHVDFHCIHVIAGIRPPPDSTGQVYCVLIHCEGLISVVYVGLLMDLHSQYSGITRYAGNSACLKVTGELV